jgi:hypothetical protein
LSQFQVWFHLRLYQSTIFTSVIIEILSDFLRSDGDGAGFVGRFLVLIVIFPSCLSFLPCILGLCGGGRTSHKSTIISNMRTDFDSHAKNV